MQVLSLVIISFLGFCSSVFAHGVSDPDKLALVQGGLRDYLWLGAKHMVTGYDHLLFIFGVVFFLTKFSDIVKFITAFTIGHSITLIFATYEAISANYYLIDAVIALSVCYKGFENVDGFKRFLKINAPNLMFMVFLFGLIHGFGLSTRLQQLPLGHHGLLKKIIAFNVGVELGQIAALTIILLLLTQWRKTESFRRFTFASNYALILAGVILFVVQMTGYVSEKFPKQHSHGVHHHEY